ncbi:selenium metabolism-associated LysR family transcriptional regulator [Priestia megaterium]|jgi:DNA-binding transcriptional LysR family regulator|uniref:LysR substrate binding domain protein n=3 Tax=Priestia TaxID=2800373 RepID=D5DRT0_PRIM1|nr:MULTISPECIES: selenium metabolism-associated LysR family transcriptional regulator [Priestia]KOP74459.1 LysR family transcriptional regulator [Bacillus sp. FJAT-21351]KQU19884.1 LysR family transcriptional regulator [Bacillus sp. Leaf75]MDH6654748.1 DNA-binding transcriptional LysR family regulator [Bacillus sp. PvP124]ADE69293.1 LysR substrate binding domain protein [Priestia megaterium QM B1551]KAA8752819.1 LysR family transcriptional regulator [Priestia megaterium]
MYYDALKTFVSVVEEQSFTKAAEKLMISQPSVSVHIKNLEKEFQTSLFLRSPKMLKITPSGEILYDRAKQMIQIYEHTKRDIYEHHHRVKGMLTIGASFTIGEYILPSFLAKLREQYPDIDVEVTIGNTKEIAQLVRHFKVDVGLIEGHTEESDLHIQSFMDDELAIVASVDHPLAQLKKIEIDDLQNQRWVAREKGSGTREYLDHVLMSNGLKMKSMLTISSNQGIKEAIVHDLGMSVLSLCAIKEDVEQKHLSILNVNTAPFKRRFSYIYPANSAHKKVAELFIQLLN